ASSPFHFQDFVLEDAVGRLDFHDGAGRFAHDGLSYGRLVGNAVVERVRLGRPHHHVLKFVPVLQVLQAHARAQPHDALLVFRRVDESGIPEHFLKLQNFALKESLFVLGVVVLGVLRDIAELQGLPDALGNLAPAHRLEQFKLLFQLGQAFGSQQHFLLTHRARSPLCCGRGLPSIVRTAVRELPAGAWERVPKFRTRLYPKAPTFVKRPMPTKKGARERTTSRASRDGQPCRNSGRGPGRGVPGGTQAYACAATGARARASSSCCQRCSVTGRSKLRSPASLKPCLRARSRKRSMDWGVRSVPKDVSR